MDYELVYFGMKWTPTAVPLIPWGSSNMGNPPKFVSNANIVCHKTDLSCLVILKVYTVHSGITAVLCAKFQNDWTTN